MPNQAADQRRLLKHSAACLTSLGRTVDGWVRPAPEFGQFDRLSDRKTLGKLLDQTETEIRTLVWDQTKRNTEVRSLENRDNAYRVCTSRWIGKRPYSAFQRERFGYI